jgi:hypothetical protein
MKMAENEETVANKVTEPQELSKSDVMIHKNEVRSRNETKNTFLTEMSLLAEEDHKFEMDKKYIVDQEASLADKNLVKTMAHSL